MPCRCKAPGYNMSSTPNPPVAAKQTVHPTSQATPMPFSLPEPHLCPTHVARSPDLFAPAAAHRLKSPSSVRGPSSNSYQEPSKTHGDASAAGHHYPASDVGSCHTHSSQKHVRRGSYGAIGLTEDLQLLSLPATDDIQSVSTSPSPSPRPPASPAAAHSAPYAPLPQSCITLPSLRASCCAASGVFSDASSDFPTSATFQVDASPARSPAAQPWQGLSPRSLQPQQAVTLASLPLQPQSRSPPCTMPNACDIRSPRPSSRRPARHPFRSPPPPQVGLPHVRLLADSRLFLLCICMKLSRRSCNVAACTSSVTAPFFCLHHRFSGPDLCESTVRGYPSTTAPVLAGALVGKRHRSVDTSCSIPNGGSSRDNCARTQLGVCLGGVSGRITASLRKNSMDPRLRAAALAWYHGSV